ncbi:MAG: polysulfide reductase NrfD [Acidimicrobiales bacterium]|nr:polysulfide reductase NrfD [Acidimicrobiales bacterium]
MLGDATEDPGRAHDTGVEPADARTDVQPFEGFIAPEPLDTEPPSTARWLAFAGILLSALLGGLIGFGTSDLLGFPRWGSAVVAVLFAASCAAGVGIVAQLTLRAMNEWNAVHHPEDRR